MKHTKEPWRQDKAYFPFKDKLYLPSDVVEMIEKHCECKVVSNFKEDDHGISAETICTCDNQEDAKRIVSCVNACAGIPDEILEKGIIKYLLELAFEKHIDLSQWAVKEHINYLITKVEVPRPLLFDFLDKGVEVREDPNAEN